MAILNLRRVGVVLGMMVLAGAAWGDVSPNPLMTGGATASADAKDTPVAMDWEEVDLTPTAERNEVTAVFLLRNTSDKATTLEVGFPSYNEIPMKEFAVEIDGVKGAAELKKQELETGHGISHKKISIEWMVWPMTFEGGAKKTVKVTYYVPPKRGDSWRHEEVRNGRPTTVFDSGVKVEQTTLPEEVKQKVASYTSGYILRTGAGWKGNIGKAVIRLHYGAAVRRGELHYFAGARDWKYDEKANVDTLTLTDFEPDEQSDISYGYRLSTPDERAGLLLEGLRRGQLDAESRMIVLKMIRAGNGQKELTAEQREKAGLEAMEFAVPPTGAAIDTSKIFPRLEDEIQGVFEKLMAEYKTTGQKEKGVKVAEAYVKFMDDAVKGYEGRYTKEWVAERAMFWAGQKKKVEAYVGEMNGK